MAAPVRYSVWRGAVATECVLCGLFGGDNPALHRVARPPRVPQVTVARMRGKPGAARRIVGSQWDSVRVRGPLSQLWPGVVAQPYSAARRPAIGWSKTASCRLTGSAPAAPRRTHPSDPRV